MVPSMNLQEVNGAQCGKPCGMGTDATHRMHRNWPAHRFLVATAKIIRPRYQLDGLLKGGMRQLRPQASDRLAGTPQFFETSSGENSSF